MIRTTIRRQSTRVKNLPDGIFFEPVPINKYNQARSAFNFKPKKTQGLVYNPPASIQRALVKTAKAFLPDTDPRKHLPAGKREYSEEEVLRFPVINAYAAQLQRTYDVTPEVVAEMKKLRQEDPKEWTINKLSKKFGVEAKKVNVFTGGKGVKTEPVSQRSADRKKRAMMWLRGEY